MNRRYPERLGRIAIVAVVGLLVVAILAGSVQLALYKRVDQVTDKALGYDLELEDQADDLRIALYKVELQHRNLALSGTSPAGIANFDEVYADLREEIDELDRLGLRSSEVTQPDRLHEMARTYYADFRTAISSGAGEDTFTQAIDRGLVRLDAMNQSAQEIDALGEQRETEAIAIADKLSRIASAVLLAVTCGLVVVGAVLAYAAVRMVGQIRELYAGEQEAKEELTRALQAKTDFLADASHELRTPLTVIHTNAEVSAQLEDDPSRRDVFEEILKESTHMSRMVEDLLFLARSDSEASPLEMNILPVPTFLAELGGRAEALARERGAHFQADLRGDGELVGDRFRLEQAVLILVDNAAKYSPPGEPVSLSANAEHGALVICVEDRGPGIPKEELPRIFERFYRVGKTRERRRGGSGLGLSIAKTIIDAHGGRMEAENRRQEGMRMSIWLPRAAQPEQLDVHSPPKRDGT